MNHIYIIYFVAQNENQVYEIENERDIDHIVANLDEIKRKERKRNRVEESKEKCQL